MNPEDKEARNTLLSIQSGPGGYSQSFSDEDIDFSFVAPEQMEQWFSDIPEALSNTHTIKERCHIDIELENWRFPDFKIPDGTTYDGEFRRIVLEGLKRRGVEKTPELMERMEYELNVIKDKGYSPYFLAVADLLHFAHKNKILTTIRGSVAGSLATYLAGITNINPLEYNIPFERFLNPDRPSAPDIDMDYADNRRDEVIAYTREKYGENNVAQIGTFGTMMARGAVRDVTRALGYDYETGDRIAKLIPFGRQGFPVFIKDALTDVPELQTLYDTDEDAKKILDMAKKIEGCARHIGVHAAGVVISPQTLTEDVPLQQDPKGTDKLITQYDMHAVGEDGIGLLKFDFLGLKNLAVLADALKRVEKIYGKEIDIEQIPLDDPKTFGMLARGETTGVFQLNGDAMTKFLKELRPSTIHDINVMVALYRPGPMKNIPEYIARKNGAHQISYYHPKMEKFLNTSYGILVYQEDIMLTAIEISGYTWKNVDKLRKAIGKKIPAEMAKQHKVFVAGCIEHSGMTQKDAEGLWDLFEPFQGYGFNKAHAASYGRVAYQTAYMKANFPTVYMSAALTADSGDTEKIAEIIAECERMQISVLPPDINESFNNFTVVTKEASSDGIEKIRFGLATIKNFGEGIGSAIIAERKEHGPFTTLANFLERIHNKNLNKKSLESLIKAGALDSFAERGEMIHNLDDLLAYSKSMRDAPKNQDSLFELMEDTSSVPQLKLKESPPITFEERLASEKELLGLYISGHPLESYKKLLEKKGILSINKMLKEMPTGATVVVYGLIENMREIYTKKGDRMAFIKIGDQTGSIEGVIFPKVYEEKKGILEDAGCVAIKGRLSKRNDEFNIVVERIKKIE